MRIVMPPRKARRLNLTPMIDVVLLLLVFFMMVSRFGGVQGVPLALAAPGGQVDWSGPPRLVDVLPQGVLLNGVPVAAEALATALAPLMAAPTDAVILRPRDGAPVQRVVAVIDGLRAAGLTRIVLAR
jgi:biopolymer transport protein ExbD